MNQLGLKGGAIILSLGISLGIMIGPALATQDAKPSAESRKTNIIERNAESLERLNQRQTDLRNLQTALPALGKDFEEKTIADHQADQKLDAERAGRNQLADEIESLTQLVNQLVKNLEDQDIDPDTNPSVELTAAQNRLTELQLQLPKERKDVRQATETAENSEAQKDNARTYLHRAERKADRLNNDIIPRISDNIEIRAERIQKLDQR